MAGVYRPRHPERTVLYRVLSPYFSGFLAECESRFERDYGYFRSVVKGVVERYLDCGNPRCGFALIRKAHVGQTKRRPDSLSRLPGRVNVDVFLQNARLLPVLPGQARRDMGRMDEGTAAGLTRPDFKTRSDSQPRLGAKGNSYPSYVQTPSEGAMVIDAGIQRRLSETLTLAKQLGAMVFTYKGQDIADTILQFAKEYRVGHVVVGNSRPRSLWKRFGRNKNVVETLIRNARGVSVIVLDTWESFHREIREFGMKGSICGGLVIVLLSANLAASVFGQTNDAAEAIRNLKLCQESLGEEDAEAEAEYQKALELNPKHKNA